MVRHMSVCRHPFQYFRCAVYRRALFITGDEKADGAGQVSFPGTKIITSSGQKAGDVAFHVGRAAAIEPAVNDICAKGRVAP